jgi:hypothetical protein
MSYLGPADLAQHDGHDVKAKGTVLYVMGCKKIASGAQ